MATDRAAPLVTVVVPCKGHAVELRECLRSVAEQAPGFAFETVVVDSASDPRVAAVVEACAGVRLVRSAADLRPGAARNCAAAQARGSYLAFLDADCRAAPGWLAHAAGALSAGARLVGGPVLDALPRQPVAIIDNQLQFADFPAGRPDGPARYFPACNMALSRADFAALGGFREDLLAGEDTLLCREALERWPTGLRFVADMRVLHTGRTSLRAFVRHQSSHGYYRGLLANHVSPRQRRWGARWIALPATAAKRLAYIAARTAQWQPAALPRLLVLLPLVLLGLGAWSYGFRRGCRH